MPNEKTHETITSVAVPQQSATDESPNEKLDVTLKLLDELISFCKDGTDEPLGEDVLANNILNTAKILAMSLQQAGLAAPAPDSNTAAIISDWLERHISRNDREEERLQGGNEVLSNRLIEFEGLPDDSTDESNDEVESSINTEDANQSSDEERSSMTNEHTNQLSELNLDLKVLERENDEPGEHTQSDESSSSTASSDKYRANHGVQICPTKNVNLTVRTSRRLRSIFGELSRGESGNSELSALEQCLQITEKHHLSSAAAADSAIKCTTTKPYTEWTPQDICNWLFDLGLGCYEKDYKKWLDAHPSNCLFTAVDIERDLNVKSPLHCKKMQLAINEVTGKEKDPIAFKAAHLDVIWVMHWLEDIGLPQFKDDFLLAKIDGRMLHYLTVEDMVQLNIYTCLHIASIRRGIECMRDCLTRRSAKAAASALPEQQSKEVDKQSEGGDKQSTAHSASVALWTAHHVMEWLRVVEDLSDYVPNLRGAGVHGALMLYEPCLTTNSLADLLNIPSNKVMLRRQLATHFEELLGRNTLQIKREAEVAPGYCPFTITVKMKPTNKAQFLQGRNTPGSDDEDLVVLYSTYVASASPLTQKPSYTKFKS